MNTQEEIEALERSIQSHKECIERKEKELQSLKESMEFKVNYYVNSMSIGNADYDSNTHKHFSFTGKISRNFDTNKTIGLLDRVNATLFMIQLADWANERYAMKNNTYYTICHVYNRFDYTVCGNNQNSFVRFNNADSIFLAIGTINSKLEYINMAKIFLGVQS